MEIRTLRYFLAVAREEVIASGTMVAEQHTTAYLKFFVSVFIGMHD